MRPQLSERQWQVLWWRAQGLSGPQVARRLSIAVGTEAYHEQVIVTRCGARNILHAVFLAAVNGWIGARADCGDRAAYLRHLRRGEPTDLHCRLANSVHAIDQRAGRLTNTPKEQAA